MGGMSLARSAVALSTDTPLAAAGAGSPGTSPQAARADHVHPAASGVLLPSGLYVPGVRSMNNAQGLTKNRELCIGLDLAPQRLARVALAVWSAAEAFSLRVGIRADQNLQPAAPVKEDVIAVASGSTGWKETTNLAYDHPGGILWLSIVGQGWATTAPNVRGNSPHHEPFIRPWAQATFLTLANMPLGEGVPLACGRQDNVTGALPATFVPTGRDFAFEFFLKRA